MVRSAYLCMHGFTDAYDWLVSLMIDRKTEYGTLRSLRAWAIFPLCSCPWRALTWSSCLWITGQMLFFYATRDPDFVTLEFSQPKFSKTWISKKILFFFGTSLVVLQGSCSCLCTLYIRSINLCMPTTIGLFCVEYFLRLFFFSHSNGWQKDSPQ